MESLFGQPRPFGRETIAKATERRRITIRGTRLAVLTHRSLVSPHVREHAQLRVSELIA
jgi:hypothetical protein